MSAALAHADNKDLQIISPLTALASMPRLRLVDLRGIHVDKSVGYCELTDVEK